MHDAKRFSQVGEIGLVPRALLNALLVFRPYGDCDPFDYIVGTLLRLWRVQVKTTMNLVGRMYHANVKHTVSANGSRASRCYTADEIDFFAIYLVPEDTWYIVPVEVVDGRLGLSIHAHDHLKIGPWLPYREAWHLLRQTGARPTLPPPEPNAPSPRRRPLTSSRK